MYIYFIAQGKKPIPVSLVVQCTVMNTLSHQSLQNRLNRRIVRNDFDDDFPVMSKKNV